jgi:hypothetical protein
MPLSRRRFLLLALAAGLTGPAITAPARAAPRPLWPGARFSSDDRDRAIRRGLHFIYRLARNRRNFTAYGDDMLWCFYSLSATAADPWLKRTAWQMGQERARRWRRENPRVPANADADDIASLVFGSHAADSLGVSDAAMKPALVEAAKRFSAVDFLKFDPAAGVIPDNVPAACEDDDAPSNSRAALNRGNCGEPTIMSRYELLTDALVTAYSGERYAVRLGASLPEVTALLPRMRPYRVDEARNDSFIDVTYAITHIIYVLNDYGRYSLRPEWLPHEFAFLKENLPRAIADNDPEMMGEFLDTLKAFGLTDADPLIRTGMAFLMKTQHADGSWGDRDGTDAYTPYHSTWTAINGLMEYAFAGEGPNIPEALRRAQQG